MYLAKLTIPKEQPEYKLYIYRSRNYKDVSTIAACRKLQPIIKIDQEVMPYEFDSVVDASTGDTLEIYPRFEFYDKSPNTPIPGFEYFGPNVNNVPNYEFESEIDVSMLNAFTFKPFITLTPLPLEESKKHGNLYSYACLGVREEEGIVSHLNVQTIRILYEEKSEISWILYSCNDYNNNESDVWEEVGAIPSEKEKLIIGDPKAESIYAQFGSPIADPVPELTEVSASLNSVISANFMTLSIQNPWQGNNQNFNFRRLKSYRIITTAGGQYSRYSEPTYQSLVPVSIEKMIIYMRTDPDNENQISFNNINQKDDNCFSVIRKDGLYYNRAEHKQLGFNLWNIPSENRRLSVFSETSVMDSINIQIPASAGHTYVFDIYLIDVYGNHNNGLHYIVNT